MAARLSALRAGRFLSPGKLQVLISGRGWVDTRAIVQLEGLGELKKFTSSGIRTSNLPACSIVPQPNTLPRVPMLRRYITHFILLWTWYLLLEHEPLMLYLFMDLCFMLTVLPVAPVTLRLLTGWAVTDWLENTKNFSMLLHIVVHTEIHLFENKISLSFPLHFSFAASVCVCPLRVYVLTGWAYVPSVRIIGIRSQIRIEHIPNWILKPYATHTSPGLAQYARTIHQN
jgi:hypothetical protein